MTPTPVALPGTASVHEAARAMRDAQIGDVMVIEHDQVCGIVTDRDIVVRTVAERQDSAATARRLPDCSSVSVRRGFVGRPSSPESPDILVDFPARFTDNISILGSR